MFKKILYFLWASIFIILFLISIRSGSFVSFMHTMENNTFDIRQKVTTNSQVHKKNDDIIIIAADDTSYEYVLEHYGEWPLSRSIYARMVEYIEKQNPQSIIFDMMFVKSMKSNSNADEALIKVFQKYDNIYTGMNLDDQPSALRIPPELPAKLAIVPNDIADETMQYRNCRAILQGIMDATSNIGMINVARSEDGVLRKMPLYLKYRDKYYPQLGYKIYLDQMEKQGKFKHVKPDDEASVILNWYGPAGTFENIPLYKVMKASEGIEPFNYNFENKIVYVGATAASLFDIKTVPVDKVYPGVEVQATYLNNLMDGTLIKQVPKFVTILTGLLLAALVVLCVFGIDSMPVASGMVATIYSIYVMIAYIAMLYKDLWLEIIIPMLFTLSAYIVAVVIKYLIKSRDFDQQYKLATTDGLTELYNHRYFQEQLQNFVSHARRYNMPLSLIIIDIDFFKKFNDSFGHQSGDAVLRQVAFVLKRSVRMSDIVCRYGGEEMSIILPSTTYQEAVNLANKLCKLVSEKKYKLSNGKESTVTISLGVSAYGTDGETPSELIEAADKRLYNAKGNGRNRVN